MAACTSLALLCANLARADLDSVVVKDSATGEGIFTVSTHEPEVPEGKQLSALFVFHGGEHHKDPNDGFEVHYRDQLLKELEGAGLADQFFIIAPHSPGNGWRWDVHDIDVQWKLRALTKWAFENYPIDPRRVYYMGRSNGGASSGPIMIGQPKLFAAMFPWTGGPEGGFEGLDPATTPDWYIVASGGENYFWSNAIIDHVRKMQLRGYQVCYREPQGFTHRTVHQRSDVYEDGFHWLLASRNKVIPPPEKDLAFLAQLSARAPFSLHAEDMAELERIGGREAGAVIQLGLKSNDQGTRLLAVDSCTRMLYGSDVWSDLVALATDKDASIRERVIQAFGVHARWRYFDALERLSAIALDHARPESDRTAAVKALDFAVELDAKGGLALDYPRRVLNMRGTRALWTCIDLLSDASSALRQLSADALNRYYPENDFAYDANAGEASRLSAAARWAKWGVETMSERERPGYQAPPMVATKRYTVTVWSYPPNARIHVNDKLVGAAPLTLTFEGTADRRFVEPTEITVDAISEDDAELPNRYNRRRFAAGDLIPDEISKRAPKPAYFRVWYGDSFLFGHEQ